MSTDENIQDKKSLTNSRWQSGNTVPRYDKRQTEVINAIMCTTPEFHRGARVRGSRHGS